MKNINFITGHYYRKTSKNVYFNRHEIIQCVAIIDNQALFSCERLEKHHQKEYNQGKIPAPGIPLEKGEIVEPVNSEEINDLNRQARTLKLNTEIYIYKTDLEKIDDQLKLLERKKSAIKASLEHSEEELKKLT
tara:strand:+ start:697 stop:1098 length:402 start_codon:yes stop_codon:yes gene_type:complete